MDEEEGCPNQDVKLIRDDGLNTSFAEEDLLPLSDEEIKLAMDGEENLVRVVGTKEDLKFDKYFKKVLRTRRGWLVEAQSLDGDDIKSLPPKDGRVKIFSIFSQKGIRLTELKSSGINEGNQLTTISGDEMILVDKQEDFDSNPTGALSISIREETEKKKELQEEHLEEKIDKEFQELFGDKLGNSEAQSAGFWVRQGISPSLPEDLTGDWIRILKEAPKKSEKDLSDMVRMGNVASTRAGHRNALRKLEMMEIPEEKMTLVQILLRHYEKLHKVKKWQASTLSTELATCQGALANLPLYRKNMRPILLKVCPEWRMGLKGAGCLGRGEPIKQPKVVTLEGVKKAMSLEPNETIRAALEVAWVTAGRGKDILRVRTADIIADKEETRVRFLIGKTATTRPYTVNTTPVSEETRNYIHKRCKEEEKGWLFPGVMGDQLKIALRRVDMELEQRSLRRGALQHLSANGVTDVDLMHISQHRQIETLKRYLAFGWLSGEKKSRVAKAKGLSLIKGKKKKGKGEEEEEEEETRIKTKRQRGIM